MCKNYRFLIIHSLDDSNARLFDQIFHRGSELSRKFIGLEILSSKKKVTSVVSTELRGELLAREASGLDVRVKFGSSLTFSA